MPIYNKLVRDRIPEIIAAGGKSFPTRILEERSTTLRLKKLHEELSEYEDTDNNEDALEELADLLELIHAAASCPHGATYSQLEEIRQRKPDKRGGFNERIFLIEVEDE